MHRQVSSAQPSLLPLLLHFRWAHQQCQQLHAGLDHLTFLLLPLLPIFSGTCLPSSSPWDYPTSSFASSSALRALAAETCSIPFCASAVFPLSPLPMSDLAALLCVLPLTAHDSTTLYNIAHQWHARCFAVTAHHQSAIILRCINAHTLQWRLTTRPKAFLSYFFLHF